MDISNLNLCVNDDYLDFNYFRSNHLTYPIFFAIPTIAFHVSLTDVQAGNNFISDTIFYLKNNGCNNEEIADKLCLDIRMVNIIVNNNENNKINNETLSQSSEEKCETKDYYIFYNLLTDEFIKDKMDPNKFRQNFYSYDGNSFNERNKMYCHHPHIGESDYLEIMFLDNNLSHGSSRITPTDKDILACCSHDRVFTKDTYKNAEYLNEAKPVWLTVGYTSIDRNSNQLSVLNPFRRNISFSNYFYNLINNFAVSEKFKNEIKGLREEIDQNIKAMHSELIDLKTNYEINAHNFLNQKYGKYAFYKGKIEQALIKMHARYSELETQDLNDNLNLKSCEDFYIKACSVLEQLFLITFEPYSNNLEDSLKLDHFFDKCGSYLNDRNKYIALVGFFDELPKDYDFNLLIRSVNPDQIMFAIRNKNLYGKNSFTSNVISLFTLNTMAYYYNDGSQFGKLFKGELIENLPECLLSIKDSRDSVSHSLNSITRDKVRLHHDFIFNLIDKIMDVKNENIINIEEQSVKGFEEFAAGYENLDEMSQDLEMACNKLLYDTYATSPTYYKDCVTSFEYIAEHVLNYAMNRITSINEIDSIYEKIPNDSLEAYLLLAGYLDKIDLNFNLSNLDEIPINISKAKRNFKRNSVLGNSNTKIVFSLLFLAEVDNIAFSNLLRELGNDFINDCFNSLRLRQHDGEVKNWEKEDLINDRFIGYCKIITKFIKEDL